VIIEAKRSEYNKQISTSQNALKTSDIVKCKTGQRKECAKIAVKVTLKDLITTF